MALIAVGRCNICRTLVSVCVCFVSRPHAGNEQQRGYKQRHALISGRHRNHVVVRPSFFMLLFHGPLLWGFMRQRVCALFRVWLGIWLVNRLNGPSHETNGLLLNEEFVYTLATWNDKDTIVTSFT